jgi:hypothetical protein
MRTVLPTNEETIPGFTTCLNKAACFNSAGQGGDYSMQEFQSWRGTNAMPPTLSDSQMLTHLNALAPPVSGPAAYLHAVRPLLSYAPCSTPFCSHTDIPTPGTTIRETSMGPS